MLIVAPHEILLNDCLFKHRIVQLAYFNIDLNKTVHTANHCMFSVSLMMMIILIWSVASLELEAITSCYILKNYFCDPRAGDN